MKLLQARILELKIICKNGFNDPCPQKKNFKKTNLKIDEEITKELSIKFKTLLGKRKESSMKLILEET